MKREKSLRRDLIENREHPLRNEIRKRVRDRVDKCDVPQCWILKDENDNGQISLDHRFFDGKTGEVTYIKRILFQITYKELPPYGRIIKTTCGTPRCVNPAHYKISGWRMPAEDMFKLLKEEWISFEEVEERFCDNKGRPYAQWYVNKIVDRDAEERAKQAQSEAEIFFENIQ